MIMLELANHVEPMSNLSNRKNSAMPSEETMTRIRLDFLNFGSKDFLIMVYCYSIFFEIDKLENMNTQQVIMILRTHFARHDIPEMAISNNGPQYASTKFTGFASQQDFNHNKQSILLPRKRKSQGQRQRIKGTIEKNVRLLDT